MNINTMRSDTTLPLHPSSVLDHITRAFLVGVEDPMLQMDGEFHTAGVVPPPPPPEAVAKASLQMGAAAAAAAIRAGKGFDGTDERVQAWAEECSTEFPTRRAAEERVFKICVALTKLMPMSNPLRVRCYNGHSGGGVGASLSSSA